MADQEPLAGMSQETTSQMIAAATEAVVLLLSQIVDKLPRVDTADRVVITGGETEAINIITRVGNGSAARPVDLWVAAMSNIGASHIYDRIEVL